MGIKINRLIVLAALAVFGFVPLSSARTPAAADGRTLSIQACSACHQVTDAQTPPPAVLNPDTLENVPPPSFTQIGRKYGRDTKALRTFIRAPAHPMREQKFLPHDLDAIVAYILSLDTRR